jgi:hypothetical protein
MAMKEKLCTQNKVTVKVKQAPRKVTIVMILQNVGANMWVKEYKTPNLGPFTVNPGVKHVPSEPRKVSEIIELFFGDKFFETLSKETNLYYFQNQGRYDGSSKRLKWVGVRAAEMKVFVIIILI